MNRYNVQIVRHKYMGSSYTAQESKLLVSEYITANSDTHAKAKATKILNESLLLGNYLQYWEPEYVYEKRDLYGRDIDRWKKWDSIPYKNDDDIEIQRLLKHSDDRISQDEWTYRFVCAIFYREVDEL